MKKLLIALAILVAMSVVVWIGLSLRDGEPRRVRVGYLRHTSSLPLFVAIEKGYLGEAGLEVQLVAFNSSQDIVEALMAIHTDRQLMKPLQMEPSLR